jgi:hypothetical protein
MASCRPSAIQTALAGAQQLGQADRIAPEGESPRLWSRTYGLGNSEQGSTLKRPGANERA